MDKKKRIAIQSAALLIQNANFKGFFTGKISKSPTKNVCVPGLNCYSCPGAIGACPIGSLQNALTARRLHIPYYVVGLILFFGALFGRLICGLFCPFGFLQDLLYKIPFPKKIRTFPLDHKLRYLKYAILLCFVIVAPFCVKLTPTFCKYICPAGTIAGILLAISDANIAAALGNLFALKATILAVISALSVLISRPFCRYLCPLGAIYGPLNHISLVTMRVDTTACTNCKACQKACDMALDPSVTPNHAECIRCGKCIEACPQAAIKLTTLLRR